MSTEVSVPPAGEGAARLRRRASARLPRLGADRWALLILPALLFVAVVFAYPVGTALVRAFTSGTDQGLLTNFEWYLGDPTQMTILRRTFTTAALIALICAVVSYPFAYLLTVVGRRWQILLLAIVIISSWQSILVRTFAWKIILREEGPLNDVLGVFGIGSISLLGTTTGVLIAMCQVMAPFMILPLYAGMRNIDMRLVDAARSLGASPASSFMRVYLPLSLPGLAAGTLLVFVISLGFYITPAIVGSPQNALLSQAIVLQIQRLLDWGHAGAMALTLFVATLLVLGVAFALLRRRLQIVSGRGGT